MEGVDWTQLPEELLQSIYKSLTVYSDYLRFRCVCRTWLSSAAKTPTHLPPQLPWLLLPNSPRRGRARAAAFLDISGNKLRLLDLPEASRATTRCRGSSHGWLAILDESPTILLLNPLTRSKLHLPPLSSFPDVLRFSYSDVGREFALRSTSTGEHYSLSLRQIRDNFIKKIVLSSSPLSSNGFVALAVLNQSSELAYAKQGDQSWRFIDGARSYSEDVVYSGGLFYAVNKYGSVAVCDVSGEKPAVSIIEMPRLIGADMQYLVSSGDDLLLVSRYLDIDNDGLEHYRTVGFEVFRMVWGRPGWAKVSDLGDRMLFIGQNSSVSFSAGDFAGCVGNCIYFTDDYSELNYESVFGECDSGIFRLCDGSVEGQWNSRCRDHWATPIWVSPNPC